jgi:hypothetical protein
MLLNMITKNESHCIRDTLESVYKYINYYVINDTGSTDNTIEVIKDFFKDKNIPGEIIEHEFRTCKCHNKTRNGKKSYKRYDFFHFGWNRSYALDCALEKSQYIWVIDADDVLMGEIIFPKNMTADCYQIKFGKDSTYPRPQIFKNDKTLGWKYKDALHEYAIERSPIGKKAVYQVLEGDYYVESRRLGDRNKNTNKYLHDAQVFEVLLKEKRKPRHMFYCAQSYFDCCDWTNAIKWYTERTQAADYVDEVFWSHMKIAMAKEHLEKAWSTIEKHYLDAVKALPDRAPEAIYYITKHYLEKKEYQKGYDIGIQYVKQSSPKKSTLFVDRTIYNYYYKYNLGVCAHFIGKSSEANKLLNIALNNGLPSHCRNTANNIITECDKIIPHKNKKNLILYTSHEDITSNSMGFDIITVLSHSFNIIIIGNHVHLHNLRDNVCLLPIDKITYVTNVDTIIMYNTLDYLEKTNDPFPSAKKILLLSEPLFKITDAYGIAYIHLFESIYISKYLKKISQIITMFAPKYLEELFSINNTSNVIEIENNNNGSIIDLDLNLNKTHKYTMKNINNGVQLKLKNITYDKKVTELFPFFDNIYNFIIESIVNQFSNIPELGLERIKLHIMNNELEIADKKLHQVLTNKSQPQPQPQHVQMRAKILESQILHLKKEYQKSYELGTSILRTCNLLESQKNQLEDMCNDNIDYIKDQYLIYPFNIIANIKDKNDKEVLFTMTTCKRFELFKKTINSFLNCCTDINKISKWLIIDDNSNVTDINKMKQSYKFFEIVQKNYEQRGHANSMNIIREYAINNGYKYVLHIEDDMQFVQKRNYISDSIEVFDCDKNIGQVLFNLNYYEVEPHKHTRITGGHLKRTKTNMRYVIHEHYNKNSIEYKDFEARTKGKSTCAYWPHFSFRPSLVKTDIYKDIGVFPKTQHFEMAYAYDYVKHGYKSAFLDTFSHIHIGKRTYDTDINNAYDLNNIAQFTIQKSDKNVKITKYESDIDTWKDTKEKLNGIFNFYACDEIKDVNNLSDLEKQLYIGNTFDYRRSVLNVISHYIHMIDSNESEILIHIRSDLNLDDNFSPGLEKLLEEISYMNYDIIQLDTVTNMIEKTENIISFEKSNGFIISHAGCKKIISVLKENGIIDLNYMQYVCPNLNMYTSNVKLYENKNTEIKDEIKYKIIDGFRFISQLDSYGNDVKHFENMSLDELAEVVKKNKYAGFNTYGYVKHTISSETEYKYLAGSDDTDGMYILL